MEEETPQIAIDISATVDAQDDDGEVAAGDDSIETLEDPGIDIDIDPKVATSDDGIKIDSVVGPRINMYNQEGILATGGSTHVFKYKLKGKYNDRCDLPKDMAVKMFLVGPEVREPGMSSLKHNNIVQFYGVEHMNNTVYIKMEVARCDLSKFQKNVVCGPLEENAFIHFALQIAEGLKYIHDSDIAHRDIKPHNILMFYEEDALIEQYLVERVTLKLCDFGFSRDIPQGSSTLTPVGTRAYLAPEVAAALNTKFRGDYKKADMFSCGLVFLELLLNQLPDRPTDLAECFNPLDNIEPLKMIREDILQLVSKMLHVSCIERISSNGLVVKLRSMYNDVLLHKQLRNLKDKFIAQEKKLNEKEIEISQLNLKITSYQEEIDSLKTTSKDQKRLMRKVSRKNEEMVQSLTFQLDEQQQQIFKMEKMYTTQLKSADERLAEAKLRMDKQQGQIEDMSVTYLAQQQQSQASGNSLWESLSKLDLQIHEKTKELERKSRVKEQGLASMLTEQQDQINNLTRINVAQHQEVIASIDELKIMDHAVKALALKLCEQQEKVNKMEQITADQEQTFSAVIGEQKKHLTKLDEAFADQQRTLKSTEQNLSEIVFKMESQQQMKLTLRNVKSKFTEFKQMLTQYDEYGFKNIHTEMTQYNDILSSNKNDLLFGKDELETKVDSLLHSIELWRQEVADKVNILEAIKADSVIYGGKHTDWNLVLSLSYQRELTVLMFQWSKRADEVNKNIWEIFTKLCRDGRKGSTTMFAVLDVEEKGIRVTKDCIMQYFNGELISSDVIEELNSRGRNCTAKPSMIEKRERPRKTAAFEAPCPQLCSGECLPTIFKWKCARCFCSLEYGFDDYLYCKCGGASAFTFQFQCNSANHGGQYKFFEKHILIEHLGNLSNMEEDTISVNDARRKILVLTKPLTEIARHIETEIDVLQNRKSDIETAHKSADDVRAAIVIDIPRLEARPTEHLNVVCTSPACSDNSDGQTAKACQERCPLKSVYTDIINNPELKQCSVMGPSGGQTCSKCGCSWNVHMLVNYVLVPLQKSGGDDKASRKYHNVTSASEMKQIAIQTLDVKIQELKNERKLIMEATAQFGIFLKKNSMLAYNDGMLAYLDYLITQEKEKAAASGILTEVKTMEDLKNQYQREVDALKCSIEEGTGTISTARSKHEVIEQLYRMKHNGSNLKAVFESLLAIRAGNARQEADNATSPQQPRRRDVFARFRQAVGDALPFN